MKRLLALLALAVAGLAFAPDEATAQPPVSYAQFFQKGGGQPFKFTNTGSALNGAATSVPVSFRFFNSFLGAGYGALANTTVDAVADYRVTATAAATGGPFAYNQSTGSGFWEFRYAGPAINPYGLTVGQVLLRVDFMSSEIFGAFSTATQYAADPANLLVVSSSGVFDFTNSVDHAFGAGFSAVTPNIALGSGGLLNSFMADGTATFSARLIPEPASLAMVGLGLVGLTGLAVVRRRRVTS